MKFKLIVLTMLGLLFSMNAMADRSRHSHRPPSHRPPSHRPPSHGHYSNHYNHYRHYNRYHRRPVLILTPAPRYYYSDRTVIIKETNSNTNNNTNNSSTQCVYDNKGGSSCDSNKCVYDNRGGSSCD